MALTFSRKAQARCRSLCRFPFFALPWLGISLAGCADTCVSFTSNPPTGTLNINVSDSRPVCKLAVANGTVHVVANAATATPCSFCMESNQVRHIFITLRGIAIHPGAVGDDASPDWRELMPELSSQPVQLDLMRSAASSAAQQPLEAGLAAMQQPLGRELAVPSGVYRQLRLSFVSNHPAADDPLPERNACRGTGFNCVVFEDGHILPLLLDSSSSALRILSERIAGGSLLVLPDATTNLVLDFRLSWALSSPDGHAVQLVPALSASLNPQPIE